MSTKLFGVVGWPIKHSASPAMMKAAFSAMHEDAVYLPFAVEPQNFEDAVRGLQALGAVGVNVTIPHKQAAWKAMARVTQQAQLAQAVNTISLTENDQLRGHNTDVDGWWKGIADHVGHGDYDVVVLGNGGAARAVLAALCIHNPRAKVRVAARNATKGKALVEAFAETLHVEVVAWEKRHSACSEARLVVNTTPVGMWPNVNAAPIVDAGCFSVGQIVQDVVYRPVVTQFLQMAQSQGATIVGGLPMLVGQGAAALEFWLGRTAPFDVMLQAAETFVSEQA